MINDNDIVLNNARGKLDRINLWWVAAFKAKITNEIEVFYNCLESIYNEGYPYFNSDERSDVEKELMIIESNLDAQNANHDSANWSAIARRNASNKCDKLARMLSLLLHKYNLEKLRETTTDEEEVVFR